MRGAAAIGGHEQRAQAGEAVGGHQPLGHQLAQRLLRLDPQEPSAVDDFLEERRAVLRKMLFYPGCL